LYAGCGAMSKVGVKVRWAFCFYHDVKNGLSKKGEGR